MKPFIVFLTGIIPMISHAQTIPNPYPEFTDTQQTEKQCLYASFQNSKSVPDAFSFVDHNQLLEYQFSHQGYSVKRLSATANNNWSVIFTINSIDGITPLPPTLTSGSGGRIAYAFGNAEVEYLHSNEGVRQNFIIHKRSSGNRKLSVNIGIQSSLKPIRHSANAIAFVEPGSHRKKLYYEQLKVWDATGRVLPAEISVAAQSNSITIDVDPSNAVFPITIDPLNRTPEWTTSADGIAPGLLNNLQLQVNSNYGFRVTALGDINGDSYADVAVSAPSAADVVTGSGSVAGVGAVFIYLGSSSGLSATPQKILQPSTAVAGALFGYSVAAGDITGDGKNDIIVGAPLDSYTTTASSILGNTSVTVKAGKVYVYRSEDLASSSNPSPFVQIRLQGTTYFSKGVAGLLGSNFTTEALFGYSADVVKDLNNDGKQDIVIGCPNYLGVELLAVQSGAAFVYYSDNLSTTAPVRLATPNPSLLGLPALPSVNTRGLLFGYSVSEAGDYNNDGYNDLVIGAPAGINLNSLGGIFTGQFLGGSAYVFTGTSSGINSTSQFRLQASASGLLSNAANLFGLQVLGATNAQGVLTGNIIVSAPTGNVLSNVPAGLRLKAGQIHVFKKGQGVIGGSTASNQQISSPRGTPVLGLLNGLNLDASVLFGFSIDNMMDVNCDNIGDIVVGEPMSTTLLPIGSDLLGGSAYILIGQSDGTYAPAPFWDLTTTISPMLGVNTTAMLGYSVAGVGYVRGISNGVRAMVGNPANALDFSSGLLNLGNTVSTLLNFAVDNNGLGKTVAFGFNSCSGTLPVQKLELNGRCNSTQIMLSWTDNNEAEVSHYQLEKSSDGKSFKVLGLVFTNEKAGSQYEFPDKNPAAGKNFYRVTAVQKDQHEVKSRVVQIKWGAGTDMNMALSPNPARAQVRVSLENVKPGKYLMKIFSAAGVAVSTRQLELKDDRYSEWVSLTGLPTTQYYFVSIYNEQKELIRTVKLLIKPQ